MFSCRVPDWPTRLAAVAAEYEGKPFVYGRSDCAHFAADCVQAVTGLDVLAGFRGAYVSRLQARARLKALGYRSTAHAVLAALEPVGGQVVPPSCAALGDVAVSQGGTILVRMSAGFVGRSENGKFQVARPETAFAVGW